MKIIKNFLLNMKVGIKRIKILTFAQLFLITSIGALSLSGIYFLKNALKGIKEVGGLQGGLSTCFRRTSQSYLAFVAAQNSSSYLTKNFSGMTKECFRDLISSFEEANKKNFSKIHLLASEVFWFYRDIENEKRVETKGIRGKVSSRYTNMEALRDEIGFDLEVIGSKYESRSSYCFQIVSVSGAILLGVSLLLGWGKWKKSFWQDLFEMEAEKFLLSKEGLISPKVEVFFRNLLEKSGLLKSRLLFMKYHTQLLDQDFFLMPGKAVDLESKTIEIKAPHTTEKRIIASQHSSHLSSVVTRVIGLFAEKIFTLGVILEIDLDEEIHVNMSEENLKEILVHLFKNTFFQFSNKNDLKKVTLKNKIIGETVIFQFIDSGGGFSPNDLLEKNIFENDLVLLGAGLSKCRQLIEVCGGRINFDNYKDYDGAILGAKVSLILRTGLQETKLKNSIENNEKIIWEKPNSQLPA